MWTNSHRLLLITLVGYALRLPLLDRFPFREDEAIYSYWALHGWLHDPLFLTVWPDKPPLFLWLLGVAYAFFGVEPASGRWLNIAAATLTIPIVAVTARRLWGDRAGLVTALLMALSPFAISFSPTVFVDPVLVLAGSLALCAAVFARPLAAGFWLGAAIMTKQQGLLYVPLIVAMLVSSNLGSEKTRLVKSDPRRALFLCGLALSTLPVIFWDSRRWATAPSPWDLSVRNYGALALIPLDQWVERLQAWWPLVWQITASSAAWIVFTLAMLGAAAIANCRQFAQKRRAGRQDRQSPHPALILIIWTLAYLFFHIATNVQIWDRYLLPLAPMLALLAGWAAGALPLPTLALARRGMVVVLFVLLALPSWQAATGALPIGSDHGAYVGLDESLDWIVRQAEPQNGSDSQQSILYHDVLGWHHQFYLYEEIERGLFTLRWFPTSTYLADNAEKRPDLRKFYVQPDWAPQPDLVGRLNMRNLTLTSRFTSGHFTVYEVTSRQADACTWCVCVQPTQPPEGDFGWKELKPNAIRPSTVMALGAGNELQ